MKTFNTISEVDLPAIADGQLYIYVLENSPQGNIKIGRTSDIQQRLTSLSGSNSGGNHITKIAVSNVTYLYTLERIAHMHFQEHRIEGTEWFDGSKISFDEVVKYIDSLFDGEEYELCNETRKTFLSTGKEAAIEAKTMTA